jgi:ditrans,polycis-polyprenyl diphosphate synthase
MMCDLHWYERFCCNVLRCGKQIPKHIAFIMDGNRRYAKQLYHNKQQQHHDDNNTINDSNSNKIHDRTNDHTDTDREKNAYVLTGHKIGYTALLRVLQWSLYSGIKCITVYAFSIDNFKRPRDEVNGLMTMAAEKFTELATNQSIIERYKVCIKFIGNKNHKLLPMNVIHAMNETERVTSKYQHMNDSVRLNICFVYSTSYELTNAALKVTRNVKNAVNALQDRYNDHEYHDDADTDDDTIDSDLLKKYVTLDTFEESLLLCDSPPLDLLIRTSGETRLSDFLCWQLSAHKHTQLMFLKPYWPELNILHFMKIILQYQYYYKPS